MKFLPFLALISFLPAARAGANMPTKLTCTTRYAPFKMGGTNATLALIECMADQALFLAPPSSATKQGPFKSDSTKEELKTAGVPDDQNFAGLLGAPGEAGPGTSMAWQLSMVLTCGEVTLVTGPHAAPTKKMYIPPPTENPIEALMASFGAVVPVAPRVSKKVAVMFFDSVTSGGFGPDAMPLSITTAAWEKCVADGTASVAFSGTDFRAGVVGAGGSTIKQYTFTDEAGDIIPATVKGKVTKEDVSKVCTKEGSMVVAKEFEDLDKFISTAVTSAALEAATNTLAALTSRRMYAGCEHLMKSMYNEAWSTVEMKNSKACTHAPDEQAWKDTACCNPLKRWSECCAATTQSALALQCAKTDPEAGCTTNLDFITGTCEKSYVKAVDSIIKGVVGPALFEANHPALGCDKVANEEANDKVWTKMTKWTSTCRKMQWGFSKTGLNSCTSDEDCWSKECKTQHGRTKCSSLSGAGLIEPMFRCMMYEADEKIGEYIAAVLEVDASNIDHTTAGDNKDFIKALANWTAAVTEQNCAGNDVRNGWCTVDLTKDQCEKLAVTEAKLASEVKWIDDQTNVDAAVGWCKMTGAGGLSSGNGPPAQVCKRAAKAVSACVVDAPFVEGDDDTNVCKDSDKQTAIGAGLDPWEAEPLCRAAAKKMSAGYIRHMSRRDYPKGCIKVTTGLAAGYYFNDASPGTAKTGSQPVCKVITTDSAKCTGAGLAWVAYGAGTFSRLMGEKTWQKTESGDYEPVLTVGSETKCEAEKGCNWDPWGDDGGDDEALCLAREGVAKGSDKMFCADCSSPTQCNQKMSLGTCAVSGNQARDSTTQCASRSGHIDWGGGVLAAGTWHDNPHVSRGNFVHSQHCLRTGAAFDTQAECLDETVCPLAGSSDAHYCQQSFCFNHVITDATACSSAVQGSQNGQWWPSMKGGTGLCVWPWLGDGKSACEARTRRLESGGGKRRLASGDFRFWEGRQWFAGFLDTQAKCETGYCQDGNYEGPKSPTTCAGNSQCTQRCALCKSPSWWEEENGRNKLCYDTSKNKAACDALPADPAYKWDAIAEKCRKDKFLGTDEVCKALSATHVYKDCMSFTEAECQEGCLFKDVAGKDVNQGSCSGQADTCRKDWDWSSKKCYAKGCKSGGDFPSKATCEGGSVGGTFADGLNAENLKLKAALECRWEGHTACPDEARCTADNTGHCEDWFTRWGPMGEVEGVCIKALEVHETDSENYRMGDRKYCDHYSPPLGWAGDFGCIDTTLNSMAKCDAKVAVGSGYKWISQAKTKTVCAAHGGTCKNKYREWEQYGGVANKEACVACNEGAGPRFWKQKVLWNGGKWQESSMWTGSWKKRAWESKNTWGVAVVEYKIRDLADGAVARMFGEVYRTRIKCNLDPIVGPLKFVACACAPGESAECKTILGDSIKASSVQLATKTVFCKSMAKVAPLTLAAGSVTYTDGSTCAGSGSSAVETIMKAVVPDAVDARRLSDSSPLRRLAACAQHEVVKNSKSAVVGQKMGSGLSSEIAKVSLCIGVTVPTSEQCAQYSIKDFARVDATGVISAPLNLTVTLDLQGRYCAVTKEAGLHIPIHRMEKFDDKANGHLVNSTKSSGQAMVSSAQQMSLSMIVAVAGLWVAFL